MFQIFEDCIRSFCIRCEDVGLDCNCIIYGNTAERVVDETFMHMYEYHAINPEEMTTSLRLKIKENMQIHSHSSCLSKSNCTIFQVTLLSLDIIAWLNGFNTDFRQRIRKQDFLKAFSTDEITMHGEWWLENPGLSISLFCIAFYLLYRALRTKKQHRYHQHSDYNDVQRVILGHKIIDTSTGWLLFTGFIALTAIGAHFLAEYTFHLYDTTPIDKFTHGLSGMAITALILNFYLTRKRQLYYIVAIGASWIAFVLWEVYELVAVATGLGGGYIQTEPMDLAIDLWVDSLGALAVCFLYDEFSHD